jgi:hypothetical protein
MLRGNHLWRNSYRNFTTTNKVRSVRALQNKPIKIDNAPSNVLHPSLDLPDDPESG